MTETLSPSVDDDTTKPILCAACEVHVEGPPDPKPDDMITCPKCGESETFKDFQRSLGEQAEEYGSRLLAKSWRNIPGVKFTPDTAPRRAHRFIVKFD